MNKKKAFTVFLAGSFMILAFVSLLAFIDNLDVAYQWHRDVISKVEMPVDGKGEKIEKIYSGLIPRMDWACVDMSVVSTLCPFLGFLLIGIGFIRILAFRKDGDTASENFPFFYDYDRIMVILGLAGTLWGIIMIGFYPSKDVTMPKLMICLHTSLYSTLVVILWIFIISRPVGKCMRWWYRKINGREIRTDANMSELFRELGSAVSGASRDFKEAGVEASGFKKQVETVKMEFKGVEDFLKDFRKQTGLDVFSAVKGVLEGLTDTCQNINCVLKNMEAESLASKGVIEKQEELAKKQQEFLNQLSKKLTDEVRLRLEAEQKSSILDREKERIAAWFEQIKSLVNGLK